MNIFNELLDWIEYQQKHDYMGGNVYYHVFRNYVLALQSKYACESLKEAGY